MMQIFIGNTPLLISVDTKKGFRAQLTQSWLIRYDASKYADGLGDFYCFTVFIQTHMDGR